MKKLKLKTLLTTLVVALCASCSDYDEMRVVMPTPEEAKAGDIELVATLKYDEVKQSWALSTESGNETYLIISSIGSYANWEGRVIKVTGQYKLLYKEVRNSRTHSYLSLNLNTIEMDVCALCSTSCWSG